MVRYADDAVFTFRSITDAERFKKQMEIRLAEYGIRLHEDKTVAMLSGRREAERHEKLGLGMPSFSFLGFLHVWGISVNKKTGTRFWRVKRRTCPKRFKKKLSEIKAYIRKNRHSKDLLQRMKRVTQGYLNYFAIKDNHKRISEFICEVERMLFKWMNRRSQRRSFEWKQFKQIQKRIAFPEARILKDPFFGSRPMVCR